MPSFRYKMIRTLFKTLRVNKMLDKTGADFEKLLETYRKKQQKLLAIPHKQIAAYGCEIEEKVIEQNSDDMRFRNEFGMTKCYVVKKSGVPPKVAVLYLFGGGYILPPDSGDLVLCAQIAQNCDAEVWFPLYPMVPAHRLAETVQATLGVYQEMLRAHDASKIRFFGTSSGGGLALSLCMYIRHENLNIPLPARLVLQSPGLQVPPSESQREQMHALSKYDVMIPPRFFDSIAPVLAAGDESYLLSPILFDLTDFPETHLFYGTHEVMFAYLADMEAACKKYGVPLSVHIGQGMMHCWGAMDFVPEARAVRKEYFSALR